MGVRAAIIGIGNLLLKDEGVGPHAIKAIGERYSFPDGVVLVDGGTMGLDLLQYLEGRDLLVLIDAVDFCAEPGTIRVMEDANIKAFLDMKFSVHQIGVTDMLFAASFSGIAPKHICLIGIQPEIIDTGIELSPRVSARFEELINVTIEQLMDNGVVATLRGA